MSNPSYTLSVFESQCRSGNVTIYGDALRDASKFFKLHTKKDVLRFIAMKEYDQGLFFKKTRELDVPVLDPIPMVDAYKFVSNGIDGYMAFFASHGKWVIKSFKGPKKEKDPLYTNAFMKQAVQKMLADKGDKT